MPKNSVDIYIDNRLTATLVRDPNRSEYAFSYAKDAQDPVSLTMPVCDRTDMFMFLPPVLETSLPEGELLEAIYRKMGKIIKLSDDFDILKLVGRNMVGRLTVVPSGERPEDHDAFIGHDRLMSLLRAEDSRELLTQAMIEMAERTGISGVLPKTFGLSNPKTRMTIPAGNYIVKAESDEFPGICVVEHGCMTACRNAGLTVPDTILSDDGKTILVKRFDIREDGGQYGFEDFCSLGGFGRRYKYDKSYEFVSRIASLFATSDNDRTQLFKTFAMMHFLKNGDAHLKNFGVLYSSGEDVRLSPTYDIVTTTSFIQNDLPALTYQGMKKWLMTNEIIKFGIQHCRLKKEEAGKLVDECLSGIEKTIPYIESLSVQYGHSSTLKTLETFRKALSGQNIPPSIVAAKTKKKLSQN
ncbi:MAG: type II toxin-antitoxin system HipA family toxin [Leptospirillum sp.]